MMENILIDISDLDKAEVLAALYNRSAPQGMGIIHYKNADMSKEAAAELLKTDTYFDYLHGRVMKIDLSSDVLDPWLYDRDIGPGSCKRIIDELRKKS